MKGERANAAETDQLRQVQSLKAALFLCQLCNFRQICSNLAVIRPANELEGNQESLGLFNSRIR